MAEFEKTEFEFPDEKEENSRKGGRVVEPEPEIEIIDDTPEEDRGRRLMDDAPKDMSEDELGKYDEGVQKRIRHFTKGYHEERRGKEAAIREKNEALRIAQAVVEENKKLKGSLNTNQNALLEQAKRVVTGEVQKAREKYKAAYESGDSDAVVEANEALMAAKSQLDRVNNFKAPSLQEQETEVQRQQPVILPSQADQKALDWQSENKWFGADDEMTSFALGLHTKLVKSGVNPQSNEYYERLNSRIKQVFPEQFDSGKPDANTPSRKSNVAPATRSTAPRKIVLTQTQVNLAKRLGVSLESYAREVAKEMRK
jgi:hypothetical protein